MTPNSNAYAAIVFLSIKKIFYKFVIDDMLNYDEKLLEKWSYGLDRTYPQFCPNFDRSLVENIISTKLTALFKVIGSSNTLL
jgi:hypothetical protein